MFYAMRERFEGFSIKIGLLFSKFPLTPNQWTILSVVPVLASFYYLVQEEFLPAALFFILAGFLDVVDGAVARVTGRVTKLGAYLDTITDRFIEGILILGLFFVSLPSYILDIKVLLFIYFFGAMMTTYVKAAAKEKELSTKEIKGGLLERAERLSLLFIGLLLASQNVLYLTYIIFALAVLSNFTMLQRIWIAVKTAKK